MIKEIEIEPKRMEPLSRESVLFIRFSVHFFIAIDLVSDDRISDGGEVYSDLMSPTCEEIYLEECVLVCDNPLIEKFRFSEFWVGWIHGCHLFAIIGITSDERLDISFIVLHDTDDECEIGLVDCSLGNLELECVHRFVIFCDDDESRCILVETMDDTGSLDSVDDGWLELRILMTDTQILKMIQQSIDQCTHPPSFSWCWMCIDPCFLGYDREVVILEDDIEWHILSYECHLIDSPTDLDYITSVYFFVLIERVSVARDLAFLDHFLEIAARLFWKKSRQVSVDSSCFSRIREDTKGGDGIGIGTTHSGGMGLSEKWARVVEYLSSGKESGNLLLSCLDRVRRMDDIVIDILSKISTDSAWSCICRIGCSTE